MTPDVYNIYFTRIRGYFECTPILLTRQYNSNITVYSYTESWFGCFNPINNKRILSGSYIYDNQPVITTGGEHQISSGRYFTNFVTYIRLCSYYKRSRRYTGINNSQFTHTRRFCMIVCLIYRTR